MLPNVRLLIAAMLASVLVLICGFGVFAAFRVSRDPIAHLPVAAPPSQLLAETRAASSAVMVAGEIADQHSRFDIPVSTLDEIAAPTGTTERHDQAELVTESEQTATPPPIAAMDTEASAAAEPEKEAAAMAPPERPPPPSTPVNDLPAPVQAGDRSADTAADAASAASPLRPVGPAADPSAGARETAPDASAANETAAGDAAPVGQTTTAEATPLKANAEPSPVTEPSAVARLPVEAMPDDALDRSEGDTLLEPPLPRARPIVSDAPRVGARVSAMRSMSGMRSPHARRTNVRGASPPIGRGVRAWSLSGACVPCGLPRLTMHKPNTRKAPIRATDTASRISKAAKSKSWSGAWFGFTLRDWRPEE